MRVRAGRGMKAAIINEFGSSQVIQVKEVPMPEPDGHDVLIRIFATGINPLDWKVRSGKMKMFITGKFPKTLGAECAGIVEAVGVLATNVKPGDRVVASLGPTGGGYAQYVIAQDKNVVKLPEEVSFEQAAVLVVGGLTALQGLRDAGQLKPNERVLINGAAGGVGTFAVQLAKLMGATVTAVASAGNADLLQQLGADRIIDYAVTDFTKETQRYDVVFDAVGKCTMDEVRPVLTDKGIYVTTLPSVKQIIDSAISLVSSQKAKSVLMSFSQSDMKYLLKLATEGKLVAIIDRKYRMEELPDAHTYSEQGHAKGKLILIVTEEEI